MDGFFVAKIKKLSNRKTGQEATIKEENNEEVERKGKKVKSKTDKEKDVSHHDDQEVFNLKMTFFHISRRRKRPSRLRRS
jgi:hypothetical protein